MAVLELNKKAKPINKWAEYIPEHLLDNFAKIDFVGSTFTCNPPPTTTDIDVLCLLQPHIGIIDGAVAPLLEADFTFNDNYNMAEFSSMKKGKINIILTKHESFFNGFIKARNVCKLLNIMDKPTRIKVHQLIMKEVQALPVKAKGNYAFAKILNPAAEIQF